VSAVEVRFDFASASRCAKRCFSFAADLFMLSVHPFSFLFDLHAGNILLRAPKLTDSCSQRGQPRPHPFSIFTVSRQVSVRFGSLVFSRPLVLVRARGEVIPVSAKAIGLDICLA
jgi:hypothetical protein